MVADIDANVKSAFVTVERTTATAIMHDAPPYLVSNVVYERTRPRAHRSVTAQQQQSFSDSDTVGSRTPRASDSGWQSHVPLNKPVYRSVNDRPISPGSISSAESELKRYAPPGFTSGRQSRTSCVSGNTHVSRRSRHSSRVATPTVAWMESFLTAQQQLAMQIAKKDLDAQRLAAEERRLQHEAAMKKEELAAQEHIRKEEIAERDRQRYHDKRLGVAEERKLAMAAEQQRLQQQEEDRKLQQKLMADWQKASADERVRQQTIYLDERASQAASLAEERSQYHAAATDERKQLQALMAGMHKMFVDSTTRQQELAMQEKEALEKRVSAERTQLNDTQLHIQSLEHELHATSQVTNVVPKSCAQHIVRPSSPGSPVLPDGGDLFVYSSVPINGTSTEVVAELPPTTTVCTPVIQDAPPRKRKAYTVTRGVNTAQVGPVEPEIQPIPRVTIQPAQTTQPQLPVVGSSVTAPVYTQCAIPTVTTTQFKPPATCQHCTRHRVLHWRHRYQGLVRHRQRSLRLHHRRRLRLFLLVSLLLYSQSILLVVLHLVRVRLQLQQRLLLLLRHRLQHR